MKKLLTLLLLVSIFSFGQTNSSTDAFLKQYDVAADNAPTLTEVNKAINSGEALYNSNTDKTRMSYYLADLYYIKATKFKSTHSGLAGVEHRGHVTESEQKQCLLKAKSYSEYFVANYQEKNDAYRSAQNRILKINSKLEFN